MPFTKTHFYKACLVLISITVIAFHGQSVMAGDRALRKYKKCNFHQSACTMSLSNATVTLDIQPKPVRAMRTLTFGLKISGTMLTQQPYIDLDMPGMVMGPNRVLMKPVEEGSYEGEGFIVKCPSGKRVWRAKVTLPGVGIVDFVFDVLH